MIRQHCLGTCLLPSCNKLLPAYYSVGHGVCLYFTPLVHNAVDVIPVLKLRLWFYLICSYFHLFLLVSKLLNGYMNICVLTFVLTGMWKCLPRHTSLSLMVSIIAALSDLTVYRPCFHCVIVQYHIVHRRFYLMSPFPRGPAIIVSQVWAWPCIEHRYIKDSLANVYYFAIQYCDFNRNMVPTTCA